MNRLAEETKDDPTFQEALKQQVVNIVKKAETCPIPVAIAASNNQV